jgi:hypothetical protein
MLTLGGLLSGLALMGIKVFSERGNERADWLPVVLSCLLVLGLFFIAVGIFGSRKDADSMTETAFVHEAILIVMIVAAPLYFLLKAIENRRKKKRTIPPAP